MGNHTILGAGGVDVDMRTGRPRAPRVQEKENKSITQYRETVKNALEITAELHNGNPILRICFEKCLSRALKILNDDEVFQALLEPIRALRHELEVAPIMAEKALRHTLGPNLEQFLEQPPAAPEGIPAR